MDQQTQQANHTDLDPQNRGTLLKRSAISTMLLYCATTTTMTTTTNDAIDQSSQSNPNAIHIKHIDWFVTVDFEKQILCCRAIYKLQKQTQSCDEVDELLILDTNHLVIESVNAVKNDITTPLKYELLDCKSAHLGSALHIHLPDDDDVSVEIVYQTTADKCTAVQWLPPSQTAGKHPYMFTQCQAIHCRSMIPCQDTTAVKFTYSATVTTEDWATPVLSAVQVSTTKSEDGKTVSVWEQTVPISSYLLAMAVGALQRREISDRCAVYSESVDIVDAAAYEFADAELYVCTAERISGVPYPWKRCDIVCLPPSFPYGGMENPCMMFITPTLLAGDRSLANVIAHEISHSWTGNYVTCASWDHFWLNEGWTVWLERKITAKCNVAAAASATTEDQYIDFAALGGYQSLQQTIDKMPKQFTSLVLPIDDTIDPDDAYSIVAYEKGFNLLLYLERLIGTKKFEEFFRAYMKHFGGGTKTTLTSNDFKQYFIQFVGDATITNCILWDEWYYGTGMPPTTVTYDRTLSTSSETLAKSWLVVDTATNTSQFIPKEDISDWTTNQITCFLDTLLTASAPLQLQTITAMNTMYGFSTSKNCEILLRYCKLAMAAGDESIVPVVTRFITTQGRMKYIRPLYKALFESSHHKDIAIQTFVHHKQSYHPIAAKMIAADLLLGVTNDTDVVATTSKVSQRKEKVKKIATIVAGTAGAVAAVGISALLANKKGRK